MKFEYIKVVEGMYQRIVEFSEKNNLVFSEENSQGKTTLLRLMMYSLGYKIPNTKTIKFDDCYVEASVRVKDKTYKLIRYGDYIEINYKNIKKQYVLDVPTGYTQKL